MITLRSNEQRLQTLIQLFLRLLFLFVAVFVAAGVFIQTDCRLDWVVAQQHLSVPVQVVKTFGLGPE